MIGYETKLWNWLPEIFRLKCQMHDTTIGKNCNLLTNFHFANNTHWPQLADVREADRLTLRAQWAFTIHKPTALWTTKQQQQQQEEQDLNNNKYYDYITS